MADGELGSWNDTPTRAAIVDFVARVTTEGGQDYVPPAERIATFDNDGTAAAEGWTVVTIQKDWATVFDGG